MPNGFGRGFGFGRGRGFGFRGSSPPWPYVGLGRGGLPRCGYFLSGVGAPPYPLYGRAASPSTYASYTPQMTREEELNYLRDEAEAIKRQLEQIEARMTELEAEKQ